MRHEPSAESPQPGTRHAMRSVKEPFVAWFEDVGREASPRVGGKGANLGEMVRAGLPVPPGFIVTASVSRGPGKAPLGMSRNIMVGEPSDATCSRQPPGAPGAPVG